VIGECMGRVRGVNGKASERDHHDILRQESVGMCIF
jgi:hypothetical protein